MGKELVDVIRARGHPEITATHPTTLMITRDKEIGPKADCVVAVGANKGVAGLHHAIKQAIRDGHQIEVTIKVNGLSETIRGWGGRNLTLTDENDIVIRKSNFTCGRTLIIRADKAAVNLRREFVNRLRDVRAEVIVTIRSLPYRSSSGSICGMPSTIG